MSASEREPRRRVGWLTGLDGLRAIAVAAVVVYHFRSTLLPGGFLGVDLFFVISGYLITRLLIGEVDQTGNLAFGKFYLRRARRLLPAAFTLIAAVSLASTLFWRDELPMLRGAVPAAAGYVSNWWLIGDHQSYFVATGRPSMLQHLWSLAIEEQFYLIWPLLLAIVLGVGLLRRRVVVLTRARLLLVAGLATALALASTAAMAVLAIRADVPYGADSGRVYFGTDTHAMGLLLGSAMGALAVVCRFRRTRPWVLRGAFVSDLLAAGALAALIVIMCRMDEYDPALYRGGFLLVSALCAIAVAAVPRHGSAVGLLLDLAPLRWLGRRSYSIYLWHWPVTVVTRPQLDIDLPAPALFALRCAVTLALAEASYRLIECPIRSGGLAQLAHAWRLDRLSPATRSRLAPGALLCGLALVATVVSGVVPRLLPTQGTVHPVSATRPITPPPRPPTTTAHTPTHTAAPASPAAHVHAPTSHSPPAPPLPGGAPGVPGTADARPAAKPAHRAHASDPAVSAFGDSVMLGAAPQLHAVLSRVSVDAVEGRQARSVFTDIRERHAAGTLAPVVVIHTGDNGIVSGADLDSILKLLADRNKVVVLTDRVPRNWQSPNNKTLASVVSHHRNAVLVDWYHRSAGHADWFYNDGLHLRPDGAAAYARLIAAAVS